MKRKYKLDYLERPRAIVLEAKDEFDYPGLKDLGAVKKKGRAVLEGIDAVRDKIHGQSSLPKPRLPSH